MIDKNAARAALEAQKLEYESQKQAHPKTPSGERRRGLLMVNTGHGKGKTTSALGQMLRASGRGLRVKLFQFLKHENAMFGEHRQLKQLGLEFQGLGDGFTWRSKDLDQSEALAQDGWLEAKAAIESGNWDLIVLDEFTYALTYGWVAWADVQPVLEARDPRLHIVITGRNALPELIAIADTVTEMQLVKHAYQAGIEAQAGIEH
jgi:cob(I)alamin adenosyltransferase